MIRIYFILILTFVFFAVISSVAMAQTSMKKGTIPLPDAKKNPFYVFLLIGQSNMAGRAPIEKEDEAPVDGCYLFNDGHWETATNPLNRYSKFRKEIGMQQLNPGYTFAKKLRAAYPDIAIGLVVSARGGTKIEEWEKGDDLYEEAVRCAKIAKETGTLTGVLWHQGESNCDDSDYSAKLKILVESLREDLDDSSLPFIAGQVSMVKDLAVNHQIAAITETIPHSAFVSSEGLTTLDEWHFDTKSIRILGERYADAMRPLLKRR